MKVNIIVSESCRSFGDCLRDLDAKGLIRGDFVLLEPGVVSNIKLLPIIKKHKCVGICFNVFLLWVYILVQLRNQIKGLP